MTDTVHPGELPGFFLIFAAGDTCLEIVEYSELQDASKRLLIRLLPHWPLMGSACQSHVQQTQSLS